MLLKSGFSSKIADFSRVVKKCRKILKKVLTFLKCCNILYLASSARVLNMSVVCSGYKFTGCGSAWLERLVWDQEVAGSNPVTPIVCGCSSMVEHQPSKLDTWVRFPSPAYVFVAQLDRATAF